MRQEAKANENEDKAEREKIEKINQADSLIFQTEKQLKEYGEKLSEGNKTAIENALTGLRSAHASRDGGAIDTALEALNNAWAAASTEMYAQTGGDANPMGGDAGQQTADAGSSSQAEDVAFEEVK